MIRTSISIGGSRISDNDFTSVNINQNIGGHHTFEIRLRQDAKKGILLEKAKSWIGQPAVIGMDDKEDEQVLLSPVKEVFKGIVTSLGLSRQSGTGELIVRGESPSIVMDDGPNTMSFTDMGLQEIIDSVIKPYSGAFPSSPSIEPKIYSTSIPYTVQYKESNFAFVARLANRYGEWFYYDGLKQYFGKPAAEDAIPLDFGENNLNYFDISVRALPARFEMKGYDYKKHQVLTEEAALKTPSNDLGKKALDIAKGQIFKQTPSVSLQTALEDKELKNLAERREQIALDEMVILNGTSQNCKLKIGAKVNIKDKIIGEDYGEYTIIKLLHDIGQGGDYINSFEAIPVEVSSPPLSAMPDPPFCETQLAKVVDVNDEKSLGRIKVEFLWQEGSGDTSPWIRVASPYSGKDKGFYIIPEVDDQVLVAFENNNPDKPYVLTGMYNGDAKPEWFDPKNHFKGFKSKAQNQWKFDDKEKSILIDAPESITMSAGKTITIKTGGKDDSTINIDVGDGTVNVTAKVVKVDAGETIEMNSGKEVKVAAKQTIKLASSKELSASGTQKVDIKGTQVAVEGSATADLKGAKVAVQGSAMVEVKGALVKIN